MLRGAVLAGEQGLLGVDGMRGRRLRIDFERGCIEIIPSADAPRLRRVRRARWMGMALAAVGALTVWAVASRSMSRKVMPFIVGRGQPRQSNKA